MDDVKLSEIYQSVSMEFAFAKLDKSTNTATQLHPFVKCRDFLGDALYATVHKSNISIYKFIFNGTKESVDRSTTTMLIRFNNKECMLNNVRTMNEFEKSAKWKRTKLIDPEYVDNKHRHYVLAVSSGCWMRSTSLVSLYTLLWRLSPKNRKETESLKDFIKRAARAGDNDGNYLTRIYAASKPLGDDNPILTVMRKSSRVFKDSFKDYPTTNTDEVHYSGGIVALFEKALELSDKAPIIKNYRGEVVNKNKVPVKFTEHCSVVLKDEMTKKS